MYAAVEDTKLNERAVLTGRDRDDERGGFSGFTPRPTKRQASIQPVRFAPRPAMFGQADTWFSIGCPEAVSAVACDDELAKPETDEKWYAGL
jgi:hypothetical protein